MHYLRLLSTAFVERGSWRNAGYPTGQRRLSRKGGLSNQRAERTSRDRAISVPKNICKMEVRRFRIKLKPITTADTCWKRAVASSTRRRGSRGLCRFATNTRPAWHERCAARVKRIWQPPLCTRLFQSTTNKTAFSRLFSMFRIVPFETSRASISWSSSKGFEGSREG